MPWKAEACIQKDGAFFASGPLTTLSTIELLVIYVLKRWVYTSLPMLFSQKPLEICEVEGVQDWFKVILSAEDLSAEAPWSKINIVFPCIVLEVQSHTNKYKH